MHNHFWFDYNLRDFLFKGFSSSTVSGFAGIIIGILSLAIIYEGIIRGKNVLYTSFVGDKKFDDWNSPRECISSQGFRHREDGRGDAPEHVERLITNDDTRNGTTADVNSSLKQLKQIRRKNLWKLVLSSVIHSIYAFLGFTLMNASMTFNWWILMAVCIGFGIGYFIFGNHRQYDILIQNNCATNSTLINFEGQVSHDRQQVADIRTADSSMMQSGDSTNIVRLDPLVVGVDVHGTDT